MKTEEVVKALLLTPSRSKRTLLNTAANEIKRLTDRCARYAEEIAVLQERTRWIPVEERLPEEYGQYICRYFFGENGHVPFFQVLDYYATDVQPHFQHEGTYGMRVTHWMPLPEGPEVE